MNDHPGRIPGWNLALRFLLEVVAFVGFGYAAWQLANGPFLGALLAIGAFVVAATLWGVFAVPGDPSRSGKAPVPVAGWLRLLLELAILAGGAAGYAFAGAPVLTVILWGLLMVHLIFSTARLRWLLAQR